MKVAITLIGMSFIFGVLAERIRTRLKRQYQLNSYLDEMEEEFCNDSK